MGFLSSVDRPAVGGAVPFSVRQLRWNVEDSNVDRPIRVDIGGEPLPTVVIALVASRASELIAQEQVIEAGDNLHTVGEGEQKILSGVSHKKLVCNGGKPSLSFSASLDFGRIADDSSLVDGRPASGYQPKSCIPYTMCTLLNTRITHRFWSR